MLFGSSFLCSSKRSRRYRRKNNVSIMFIKEELVACSDAELLTNRNRNSKLTLTGHSCEFHISISLHFIFSLLYYTPKKSNALIGDVQQEKRITRLSLLQ